MSVLIPMEGVNMTVLIQLVTTTAHVLLNILLMRMVTIVLVSNSTAMYIV